MNKLLKALNKNVSTTSNQLGTETCFLGAGAGTGAGAGAGPVRFTSRTKRSRDNAFNMSALVSSIDSMSYMMSHLVPATLAVMTWVNKNPCYNYAKTYRGWRNEIKSKFSTLIVRFPLSILRIIADRYKCPIEFKHIHTHLASNLYLIDRDGVHGIVKISIDTDKLFAFLMDHNILVGCGRRLYLEKHRFDEVDFKMIRSANNQKIKHRRY